MIFLFYLNYVGFKHIGGLGLVVLSELCEGALAYFSSAGVQQESF